MIFSRSFFNVALEDMMVRHGQRILLHLLDRTHVEVCHVVELKDSFLIVAVVPQAGKVCEDQGNCASGRCGMALEFIPYAIIDRIQIVPTPAAPVPMGFHLTPDQIRRKAEGKAPLETAEARFRT